MGQLNIRFICKDVEFIHAITSARRSHSRPLRQNNVNQALGDVLSV